MGQQPPCVVVERERIIAEIEQPVEKHDSTLILLQVKVMLSQAKARGNGLASR